MNKEGIIAVQQRILSIQRVATCLALRSFNGTYREYKAVGSFEYENSSDALQVLKEWQFQAGPGVLKLEEGKEAITAYT